MRGYIAILWPMQRSRGIWDHIVHWVLAAWHRQKIGALNCKLHISDLDPYSYFPYILPMFTLLTHCLTHHIIEIDEEKISWTHGGQGMMILGLAPLPVSRLPNLLRWSCYCRHHRDINQFWRHHKLLVFVESGLAGFFKQILCFLCMRGNFRAFQD